MEDLKLVISNDYGWELNIKPSLEDEKVYLSVTNYFGDETAFLITKKGAKQIVEHLTKVFEL